MQKIERDRESRWTRLWKPIEKDVEGPKKYNRESRLCEPHVLNNLIDIWNVYWTNMNRNWHTINLLLRVWFFPIIFVQFQKDCLQI